uniref:LOB domain-containing protein n=1 Tax=Cucumis sativus TaxID=3659 RepID=A0A0A0KU20_CUCSA
MQSSSPPPCTVVLSPCAACKILRRRCVDKCILAPYFPPTDPFKFAAVHRIYGAGNVIKFLQELPEGQRADAASSLVYEANARIRDPIYGCTGSIFQLQNKVRELHAQLAVAKAEVHKMQQLQHPNLLALPRSQFQEQQNYCIFTQLQNFPFPDFTSHLPHL